MDAIVNLVWGIGTVVVAAAVAVVVGRRRGIDQIEDRADGETRRLVDAQAARLALQDLEMADLRSRVAALTTKVAALESELALERRITARLRADA